MLPFKKILYPTDFSEASFEGLRAADELARLFSAQVRLIHLFFPVSIAPAAPATFSVPLYQREAVESAKKGLNDLAKNKFPAGLTVTLLMQEGSPAERIIGAAEDSRVDLSVIPTRGQTEWRRCIPGSVAERVVRLASCAVRTVQPPHGEE
jgi:nucleotide-binding universal stress UspA family protein